MTATNHGLMGLVIGALLPLPYAVPLALASHFVLDALPHYGIAQNQRNRSKKYKLIVAADAITVLTFAALAASFSKWNMLIVGLVAFSPDFMWVISFFRHKRNLHMKTGNFLSRFHKNIQKLERPWGVYVDAGLFSILMPTAIYLLVN